MRDQNSFFVGYLPAPPDVRRHAILAGLVLLAGFVLAALTLGRSPLDIGASSYGDELAITGVYSASPYPIVVSAPDTAHPRGRTIMLGGEGKVGAQNFGAAFDGRTVTVKGVLVKRGALDMLLVGGADQFAAASAAQQQPAATPLGRWRISGEICDGKCASGGMRPGVGLAHRACANLCISTGLPPVLVTSAPVEGSAYLLLANADGGAAPAAIADLVALPVTLEGELERRGDLLIFRVDWSKAKTS